ncbi:hypothetical protein PtB15_9B479 [Puccinia triticina]|nr:hypothetical protein PtB15_9B479 [Puccinia triticina]
MTRLHGRLRVGRPAQPGLAHADESLGRRLGTRRSPSTPLGEPASRPNSLPTGDMPAETHTAPIGRSLGSGLATHNAGPHLGGGPSREGAAVETDESGAQNDSRGRTDTARGLGRRPIKPEPRSCAASPGRGSRESEHETTRGSHRPPSDHATRWDIAGSAQRRRLATPTGFLASIRLDLYKRVCV